LRTTLPPLLCSKSGVARNTACRRTPGSFARLARTLNTEVSFNHETRKGKLHGNQGLALAFMASWRFQKPEQRHFRGIIPVSQLGIACFETF